MNKSLPLSTGLLWIRQGWVILSKAPMTVLGIVSLYLLLVFLLGLPGSLPYMAPFGVILSALATPFGALAITTCGKLVHEGQRPLMVTCWKEGWKDMKVRNTLLALGLVYGVCVLATGLIFDLLAASSLAKWTKDGALDLTLASQNIPWAALIFGFFAYAAILCITCFSPMLVAWKKQSLAKAFFFSLFIYLKNIGAIIVLGLFVILMAVSGSAVISIMGDLGSMLLIFWGLFITCLSYSCLWPMWYSIFGDGETTVAEG